ncbi:hypothetical protein MSG28_001941 [Choristoneura fumiferana]|uniref:Uncharacterized protein n=1 Tax=Choristoneura fumiferana TaxID=7141 RepID=A0ACC0JT73_CHOFU|nr:hypothetical protein MSG28_001941 [Choristoneura fumiferana]
MRLLTVIFQLIIYYFTILTEVLSVMEARYVPVANGPCVFSSEESVYSTTTYVTPLVTYRNHHRRLARAGRRELFLAAAFRPGAAPAPVPFLAYLSTRASANIVDALQNRGSPNSALKALLYWTRRELTERCVQLAHRAPEYIDVQYALKSVILTALVLCFTAKCHVTRFDVGNERRATACVPTFRHQRIVITFYLVFYAVLALMFSLCMGGLFLSLDNKRPTYTLDRSLIGSNPGVTTRPLPAGGELKISRDETNSTDEYVKDLAQFFEAYENESFYKEQTVCVRADNFGYPDTPCIFVKLNKILDWEPEYYNDVNNIPEDFPADLVEHIKDLSEAERSQLWVWCFDETGNGTVVEYPWGRALPGFQPFRVDTEYKNPILAVQLTPEDNQWNLDVQISHIVYAAYPLEAASGRAAASLRGRASGDAASGTCPTADDEREASRAMNTHTVIRCRVLAKNVLYNKSIKEASGYARVLIHIEENTAE